MNPFARTSHRTAARPWNRRSSTGRRSSALLGVGGAAIGVVLLAGCGGNGLQTSQGSDPSVSTPSSNGPTIASASPSDHPSSDGAGASSGSSTGSGTGSGTGSSTGSGSGSSGGSSGQGSGSVGSGSGSGSGSSSGGSGSSSSSGSSSTAGTGSSGGSSAGTTAASDVCSLADLSVSVTSAPGGGAAGSDYLLVGFRNHSDSTCTLDGHPGVSFVGNGDGTQLGSAAKRTGSISEVRLSAGRSTSALLQVANAGNYGAQQCAPTTADGFRIYPPGSYAAAYVPFKVEACQRSTGTSPQLQISAVGHTR